MKIFYNMIFFKKNNILKIFLKKSSPINYEKTKPATIEPHENYTANPKKPFCLSFWKRASRCWE